MQNKTILSLVVGLLLSLSCSILVAEETYKLYLFRHAEKMQTPKDNPGLTEQGLARAKALQAYFIERDLEQIFSSNYQRTLATAEPVAVNKQIKIEIYDPRKLKMLANRLTQEQLNTLVVGHSNTTPELVAMLGGKPLLLKETDYGDLTILSINKNTQFVKTEHFKVTP